MRTQYYPGFALWLDNRQLPHAAVQVERGSKFLWMAVDMDLILDSPAAAMEARQFLSELASRALISIQFDSRKGHETILNVTEVVTFNSNLASLRRF